MSDLKNKIGTMAIVSITLILAGIAIFTAYRLYQQRKVSVSPTSPESSPFASEVATECQSCGGFAGTECETGLECLYEPGNDYGVCVPPGGKSYDYCAGGQCSSLIFTIKTATISPTVTITPTGTLSPTPTPTGTITPIPTNTPTPTGTTTPIPTDNPTPTPTPTSTIRPIGGNNPTPTNTTTPTPTNQLITSGTPTSPTDNLTNNNSNSNETPNSEEIELLDSGSTSSTVYIMVISLISFIAATLLIVASNQND